MGFEKLVQSYILFRVPLAGKIHSCLFDKTGTLTTDELVAVGISPAESLLKNEQNTQAPNMVPLNSNIPSSCALVLGGCHSLVLIDGSASGDPIESAALKAMEWELLPGERGRTRPLPSSLQKKQAIVLEGTKLNDVSVVHRHHFSSKLQRMSTICEAGGCSWVTVKGSPEAIGKIVAC